MIQVKNCSGQNKAKSFKGCDVKVHVSKRKFGLCPKCLYEWMNTTQEGKVYKEKQFLPKVSKKIKANKREQKTKSKRALMSPDKYRAQVVQPVFNEIIRLIDYDNPCIATGTFEAKMNAGHYVSVGSNRTLALNAHNVHIQSFQSNHWQSGDTKKYQEGITEVYGKDYLDFIDSLKQQRPIKLNKPELEEIYKKCLEIRNDLKSVLEYQESNARIVLRNLVNQKLGIYEKEYSQFKIKELK